MPLFGNKRKSEAVKQIQEQVPANPSSHLKDLIPNDEKMYLALQNFLLADPERQVPMLGETNSLLAKGDAAREKGEKLMARVNYETAAKIDIYKQDKDGAEKCIRLAREVTENEDPHLAFLETMLANMDEVLRISKLYYSSAAQRKA